MKEADKSKYTMKFLQTIAQHLSSRPECKKLVYRIAIGVDDPFFSYQLTLFEDELADKRVCFHPSIYVYPDIHHRKDTDKINVVQHVASAHFEALLYSYQESGGLYLNTENLVKGIYEYQSSIDGKKRRWVRVDSL